MRDPKERLLGCEPLYLKVSQSVWLRKAVDCSQGEFEKLSALSQRVVNG